MEIKSDQEYIGHVTGYIDDIKYVKSTLELHDVIFTPRETLDSWYTLLFPDNTKIEVAAKQLYKITLPSGYTLSYIPPKFNGNGTYEIIPRVFIGVWEIAEDTANAPT